MPASKFDEDAVTLELAGQTVGGTVHDYQVDCGILEVPAAWSMTLGNGGSFTELAAAFPPVTPFRLFIGDTLVQSGESDLIASVEYSATEMRMTGRDALAPLADTHITDEQTFSEKTFKELTLIAMKAVGLGDRALVANNTANRKAITGNAEITETDKAVEEALIAVGLPPDTATETRTVYKTVKAEVGMPWLEFLTTQNRRAGLFNWAAANGSLVLSTPNGSQIPMARIMRRDRGYLSTVIGKPSFEHNAAHRYSEVQVMSRTGGGRHGRGKILGSYIDQEMVALLNPDPANRANGGKRQKPFVIKDHHCRTTDQANYLARRKMAEIRRTNWRLRYTVSGHSAPALHGGGRVIWQPDTVVEVIDDELGIEGPMYLESVTFKRSPGGTTTDLHLMRCEDLIFAEDAPEMPKLRAKPGVTSVDHNFIIGAKEFWTSDPNTVRANRELIGSTRFTDQAINLSKISIPVSG